MCDTVYLMFISFTSGEFIRSYSTLFRKCTNSIRPLQINFLFPVHRPRLFPVNTKNSIISVIFHYLRFFSYTLVEYNRHL